MSCRIERILKGDEWAGEMKTTPQPEPKPVSGCLVLFMSLQPL